MVYFQLRDRITVAITEPVTLSDIAAVDGPRALSALLIPCPHKKGIWQVDSLKCVQLIQQALPNEDITALGADSCCVHRVPDGRHDFTRPLRSLVAMLILLVGSALGLAWFHSDVSMPKAMQDVYMLITGSSEPADERFITIPYIIGVALGTAVFYALASPKAVTPLDVKLSDYQEDMERAEARHVE